MDSVRTWAARVGAVLTAVSLAVFVPAVAWASTSGVYDVADELVRGRRSRGFGGIVGLLCCLVVVGVVVVAVLLIIRSRRGRRR
jgi:succinate dehydrogenase hydrophobic anchor subunit